MNYKGRVLNHNVEFYTDKFERTLANCYMHAQRDQIKYLAQYYYSMLKPSQIAPLTYNGESDEFYLRASASEVGIDMTPGDVRNPEYNNDFWIDKDVLNQVITIEITRIFTEIDSKTLELCFQ